MHIADDGSREPKIDNDSARGSRRRERPHIAPPRDRAATAAVRPAVIIDERRTPTAPSAAASPVKQAMPASPSDTSPTPKGRTVRTGSTPAQRETLLGRQHATQPQSVAPTVQAGSIPPGGKAAVAQLTPAAAQRSTNDITSSTLSSVDIDFIVRELEQRVLAELDRRGGRYTGSF